MKVVIQRVKSASVTIDGSVFSSIQKGFLILLGIEENDTEEDALWLCGKIKGMRIFGDEEGKMNLDIHEAKGDILVVSQFTLHAMTKKGNRPSFIRAARPEQAIPLYEYFVVNMKHEFSGNVFTGSFGAMMDVALVNDGPVTILMDSKARE
jgi:D-tyrosyl-tRNA(Tyr) deacylase